MVHLSQKKRKIPSRKRRRKSQVAKEEESRITAQKQEELLKNLLLQQQKETQEVHEIARLGIEEAKKQAELAIAAEKKRLEIQQQENQNYEPNMKIVKRQELRYPRKRKPYLRQLTAQAQNKDSLSLRFKCILRLFRVLMLLLVAIIQPF